MFDFVNKNKSAVTVVLGLVALGLVVGAGLTGYGAMQDGGAGYLAKVGNAPITERDLAQAIGNQAVSDEMKPMVLEQLVRQRLLEEHAAKLNLSAPDGLVRDAIAAIPAFQVDGKFNDKRYQEMLAAQQMTPGVFEQKVRQDIVLRQLMDGFVQTGFVSNTSLTQLNQLMGEKREVAVAAIAPDQYLAQVSVSDAEIKQYFDSHQAEFKAPEMVKLEYLTLSQDDLAAAQVLSDADIAKYFAEHQQELAKEERRVSHILLTVAKDAKAADKTAVRKQAEAILVEVKSSPAKFAELAKQKSQDPGSAVNGGDLGFFARGAMVKAFDDTAFKLKKGEISAIVETEFGFHILQLNDIKSLALADVKPQIEQKLKLQQVQSKFPAMVEKFNELVYQKSDSLKPAADELKLTIQQSGCVMRKGSQDPALNFPKLVDAVFSDDVLKSKHNSEGIEVSPGRIISARVIEHKPASSQALAEVSATISTKLKQEKALKLATEDGAKKLTALKSGSEASLAWAEAKGLTRIGVTGVADADLKAIFKADVAKLPAYVGSAVAGRGFVIYKVTKVESAPALSEENKFRMVDDVAKMYGQVQMTAYLESLKKEIKVQYHKSAKPE